MREGRSWIAGPRSAKPGGAGVSPIVPRRRGQHGLARGDSGLRDGATRRVRGVTVISGATAVAGTAALAGGLAAAAPHTAAAVKAPATHQGPTIVPAPVPASLLPTPA